MTKLPKKLKIGGHVFDVEFPYKFKDNVNLMGQCDTAINSIKIMGQDQGGNEYAESKVWSCFFHEILHACDILTAYKIFDDNEPALDAICEMLYQVLNDNKLLKKPK